jgi:hypothetical protein
MPISEIMPDYDFGEHHAVDVDAPVPLVYAAVRDLDVGSSIVTRVLLALRGLGLPRSLDLQTFLDNGFAIVAEREPEELVLGVVGRPWLLLSRPERLDAAAFTSFDRPGFVKIAWSFRVEPRGPRAHLSTETRVLCTDASAWRRFRPYWCVVRPFSGLIRREMLRALRESAEASG